MPDPTFQPLRIAVERGAEAIEPDRTGGSDGSGRDSPDGIGRAGSRRGRSRDRAGSALDAELHAITDAFAGHFRQAERRGGTGARSQKGSRKGGKSMRSHRYSRLFPGGRIGAVLRSPRQPAHDRCRERKRERASA